MQSTDVRTDSFFACKRVVEPRHPDGQIFWLLRANGWLSWDLFLVLQGHQIDSLDLERIEERVVQPRDDQWKSKNLHLCGKVLRGV